MLHTSNSKKSLGSWEDHTEVHRQSSDRWTDKQNTVYTAKKESRRPKKGVLRQVTKTRLNAYPNCSFNLYQKGSINQSGMFWPAPSSCMSQEPSPFPRKGYQLSRPDWVWAGLLMVKKKKVKFGLGNVIANIWAQRTTPQSGWLCLHEAPRIVKFTETVE